MQFILILRLWDVRYRRRHAYQRHVAVLQVRLHPPPALLLLPVRLRPSQAGVAVVPDDGTSQFVHRSPLPIQDGVAVYVGGWFLQVATPEVRSRH